MLISHLAHTHTSHYSSWLISVLRVPHVTYVQVVLLLLWSHISLFPLAGCLIKQLRICSLLTYKVFDPIILSDTLDFVSLRQNIEPVRVNSETLLTHCLEVPFRGRRHKSLGLYWNGPNMLGLLIVTCI